MELGNALSGGGAANWPAWRNLFSGSLGSGSAANIPMSAQRNTLRGHGLKFGFEPLTWLSMTTGAFFVQQGLDFMLKDIQMKTTHLELNASKLFQKASTRLEIAQNIRGGESRQIRDKLEYIRKGEDLFSEAATDFQLSYLKAECYKYAAICARLGGRSNETVREYIQLARNAYHKSPEELSTLYRESRNPVRNLSPAFRSVITEALWLPLWLAGKLADKNEWTDAARKLALGRQHVALREKTVTLIEQYIHSDLPMICNRLEQSIATSRAGSQAVMSAGNPFGGR